MKCDTNVCVTFHSGFLILFHFPLLIQIHFHFQVLLIKCRVVFLAWEYIALKNHVMSKTFVSHFIPDFLFSSTFHCSFKFIFTSNFFSLYFEFLHCWLSYSRWVWS